MPVRNEEEHLRAAVERVLDQDYPGDRELIMAVGPSTDRTAEIAEQLAAEHPGVLVVDNPTGRTPAGLNRAVARSRYEVIVRVDGHGELTDDYIVTAVELLERTGAVNVGGVMDARGRTPFEEAVACGYNTRLGLGGGTFHLKDSPEGPADTVFLGVFRKEALNALGGFDESLHRAQDWELNHRLRQAGGQVFFSPRLKVTYRPRSSFGALGRQFFETGRWRREVIRRHPDTASVRYLAAPVAVAGIAGGTILGLVGTATRSWLRIGWAAPLGYGAIVTLGSLLVKGISPPARARLPFVYATMHLAWGSGFLVGLDADQRAEGEPAEPPTH
ncbi:MAG: glycosyltransferase family 2 protein [Propionibacteriales bacterium]|nr:glycosyltransferase family 2 protein [Propionibacteriales bacterium]